MPKYYSKEVTNNSEIYDKLFEKRGVESITQYRTKVLGEEVDPDSNYYIHYWSQGDRLYKLSFEYYGSYDNWWKIAFFNGIGSEVNIKIGDLVKIPAGI
tara:strand:+ start:482 stop:778 length:297 start_codon:yes stop_codon:yes gene_type:complete